MMQDYAMLFLKFTAIYFLGINFIYGLLTLLSWIKVKKFRNETLKAHFQELPSVSFIIPAFNEESLIVETLQTYLSLPQANKEIIVINDGSKDQTFKLLQTMFLLRRSGVDSNIFQSITHPVLKVIEAPHKGKAHSLNLGIRHATYDLVCTMDADTIPTAEGVETSLKAFAQDSSLIAAGGIIHVLNSQILKQNVPHSTKCDSWLTTFQSIEYLRTFLCVRLGWSIIGSTSLISGAFCMLKKEAWRKVGGFNPNSITEDLDLIIRLRKAYPGGENKFRVLPVVTCFTQVPKDKKHLMVQRMRWQMGLVQTLSRNLSLLFHPGHGCLGFVAIPYYWLAEVLSPVFEMTSFILIPIALVQGWVDPVTVFAYLFTGLVFHVGITVLGSHFDNNHVSLKKNWSYRMNALHTIYFHFGYKQMTSWWRLLALLKSFRKSYEWGEKPRQEIIHQTL